MAIKQSNGHLPPTSQLERLSLKPNAGSRAIPISQHSQQHSSVLYGPQASTLHETHSSTVERLNRNLKGNACDMSKNMAGACTALKGIDSHVQEFEPVGANYVVTTPHNHQNGGVNSALHDESNNFEVSGTINVPQPSTLPKVHSVERPNKSLDRHACDMSKNMVGVCKALGGTDSDVQGLEPAGANYVVTAPHIRQNGGVNNVLRDGANNEMSIDVNDNNEAAHLAPGNDEIAIFHGHGALAQVQPRTPHPAAYGNFPFNYPQFFQHNLQYVNNFPMPFGTGMPRFPNRHHENNNYPPDEYSGTKISDKSLNKLMMHSITSEGDVRTFGLELNFTDPDIEQYIDQSNLPTAAYRMALEWRNSRSVGSVDDKCKVLHDVFIEMCKISQSTAICCQDSCEYHTS